MFRVYGLGLRVYRVYGSRFRWNVGGEMISIGLEIRHTTGHRYKIGIGSV